MRPRPRRSLALDRQLTNSRGNHGFESGSGMPSVDGKDEPHFGGSAPGTVADMRSRQCWFELWCLFMFALSNCSYVT